MQTKTSYPDWQQAVRAAQVEQYKINDAEHQREVEAAAQKEAARKADAANRLTQALAFFEVNAQAASGTQVIGDYRIGLINYNPHDRSDGRYVYIELLVDQYPRLSEEQVDILNDLYKGNFGKVVKVDWKVGTDKTKHLAAFADALDEAERTYQDLLTFIDRREETIRKHQELFAKEAAEREAKLAEEQRLRDMVASRFQIPGAAYEYLVDALADEVYRRKFGEY